MEGEDREGSGVRGQVARLHNGLQGVQGRSGCWEGEGASYLTNTVLLLRC